MKKRIILITFILLSILINNTYALDFFTVNNTTNQLCRINYETGELSIIGTIDFEVENAELFMFGGKMFALSSNDKEQVCNLLELNPLTGKKLSSAIVTLNGTTITAAEAVISTNDRILIGFSKQSNYDTESESIGELSLDGSISNVKSFNNADFDGLGFDYTTNQIYSIDITPQSKQSKIYKVDLDNLKLIEWVDLSFDYYKGNDFDIISTSMFFINNYDKKVHMINIASGNIEETISLKNNFQNDDFLSGIQGKINYCSFSDIDEDGVIDQIDNCPNTKLGSFVDKTGCAADGIFINNNQAMQIVECMKNIQIILDKIGLEEAIQALKVTAGVKK